MKRTPRKKSDPPQSGLRVLPTRPVTKRQYLKPRVEPAGSLFRQTMAGPLGTKDGITTGSSLL